MQLNGRLLGTGLDNGGRFIRRSQDSVHSHKKSRGISFYAGKGLVLNNTIRLLAVDATISSQLEVFLDNCLHCWLPQCLPLLKHQITAAINVLRLVLRHWLYQKYSTKMSLCYLFTHINFYFI